MYKGTTPSYLIRIPYKMDEIDLYKIYFSQKGKVLLTFDINNSEIQDDLIIIKLTQEQANLFNHKYSVQIQMRIKEVDGTVAASPVITTSVHRVLNNEVI